MNNIKNKLSDSSKITDDILEYFDSVEVLIENRLSDDKSNIRSTLNLLPAKNTSLLQKLNEYESANYSKRDQSLLIEQIFIVYDELGCYFSDIKYLMTVLDSPYLQVENLDSSDYSGTYKLEALDKFNHLRDQYVRFENKYEASDAELSTIFADRIFDMVFGNNSTANTTNSTTNSTTSHIREILPTLQENFYKHKNAVRVYASIIQKTIDTLYDAGDKDSKQLMFYILELVETDKDFFISGNVESIFTDIKNVHLVNPALKRFGLVPVTDSMSLDKLIVQITDKKSTAKNINLQTYAKEIGIGFIVMHHVVYDPIEYDLKPLINPDIAKCLTQPSEYGITEKTLERFRNIRTVGEIKLENDDLEKKNGKTPGKIPGKPPSHDRYGDLCDQKNLASHTAKHIKSSLPSNHRKWNFNYRVIDSKDTQSYYVIETLDGIHYRALAPWLSDKNLAIGKFRLTQLLQYIADANEPNRIANYHQLAIHTASSNMFLKKPLKIEQLEEQAKDIDTHFIKNDLYLKIILLLHDIIDTDYNRGKRIKSDLDINNIIHDERIKEVFTNTIFALYDIGAKSNTVKEFEAGKFPFYEVLSSFILELEDINRRFLKDLHDLYNRDPLDKSVFSKSDSDKLAAVQNKLEDCVLRSIQLVISDKDNIYSSINFKYLLLNFY